jgi:hypothetical protein
MWSNNAMIAEHNEDEDQQSHQRTLTGGSPARLVFAFKLMCDLLHRI